MTPSGLAPCERERLALLTAREVTLNVEERRELRNLRDRKVRWDRAQTVNPLR